MSDNSLPPNNDNLTELQFIFEMRAMLDQVDDGFANCVMQQMSDEMAKRPGMDHKLTTIAKFLLVLMDHVLNRDRTFRQ